MVGFMGLAITQVCDGECVSVSKEVIHRGSRSSKWPACSWADRFSCGLPTNTSVVTLRIISSRRAGVPHRRTQTLGYCSAGKVKSNFHSNHAGTLLDSGRGKLCSHHGPTWNSEALRLITVLFLLRVHFTVRIDFPIQMSPQPSLSQRSNQTESATRPRRCAHGLLALQRLR